MRTKVPLKKKVRGERNKKKSQQKVIIPSILPQKDVIPSNVTSNAVNPTLPVSATSIKPLSRSQKKSLESPKKLLRKKKKSHRQVSGPDDNSGQMKVKDDQQQQQQQQLPIKPQRKPKKKPSSSSSKHKEIIDYLISYCSELIQQLPVKHQIRISTTAYDSNQLDVLCDLLEFSDFPFPQSFHDLNLTHERLQKIIADRIKFHEGIKNKNDDEIKAFINNNLSLKFIYSPQNITAMKQAVDSKNYKIYYYLKSFGFCATEFNDLSKVLKEEELKEAIIQENLQIEETMNEALCNPNRTVSILCTKSLIHNRRVKNEDEQTKIKYRKCIKKWLGDIYKVAKRMLDIAASCEDLKIIFDFESQYVR